MCLTKSFIFSQVRLPDGQAALDRAQDRDPAAHRHPHHVRLYLYERSFHIYYLYLFITRICCFVI